MKAVRAVYNGEKKVLDVCAAPGGKSAYLCALSRGLAKITACDANEDRVLVMRDNFLRLNVSAGIYIRNAASKEDPLSEQFYDLVIVDAPCSGSGEVFKKPDIKLNRSEEDIKALKNISAKILRRSALRVKPGGKLAFFTCSVFKEENEDQIYEFLNDHPEFHLLNTVIDGQERCIKTFDVHENEEGFFVCLMRKQEL